MAVANVGRINHAEPSPIDNSVLSQQANHRSEAIWNRQDPRTLTCRSHSKEFSNREAMVDDQVINIIKALGLEGLLWLPGSTQKTWTTVCQDFLGFQPGVLTPDPSPYTPHPSPRLTIPSSTPHPSPTLTISSPIPHPSPTLTIPSSIPHPFPSLTIPSTIPHSSPRLTIPPPTPHPPGSDIHPPHPQSFPELSPIPSFYLGLDPTPPDLQQQPPSHSSSIAPSSAIDLPMFRLSRLLGYLQWQKGGQNAYQRLLLVGQGGTNMDTTLGLMHMTKSMPDLLLVIPFVGE
nr:hypothetical protein CFP56_75249 [Quercus suber]